MTTFLRCMLFLALIWLFESTEAFPRSGLDLGGSRTRRDIHCRDNLHYLSGNICCLNCPAGTRTISHCTKAQEKGKCEECDDGTFIEHASNMEQCFKCTQCRSDQEIVRPCTHTQNTECQCKPGRFCDPDQACEVCKRCSRCEKDEEVVRNCTATVNTICKKAQPNPASASASEKASFIVPLTLLAAAVIVAFVIGLVQRRRRATDSPRNLPDELKAGQHYSDNCSAEERRSQRPSCSSLILSRQLVRAKSIVGVEDERQVLCESLSSSASNSQHSLTVLPSSACPAPPPVAPRQPNRREDEEFAKLVPVNGEESLRKCFEYFEEMDVDCHKRFFRHLGLSDNVIKSKEHLPYEDKIHELLNVWVEKVGREASLNDLLKALLDLNQRRTAEMVKESAVQSGHYLSINER